MVDKERICYDLAMQYAQRMFGFYLEHMRRYEMNDTASLTKKLFCFFEEAFITYLQMDDKEFDFAETLRYIEKEKEEQLNNIDLDLVNEIVENYNKGIERIQ